MPSDKVILSGHAEVYNITLPAYKSRFSTLLPSLALMSLLLPVHTPRCQKAKHFVALVP